MNLFPSEYAMWAFWILTAIWLAAEFIGASLIPALKRGGGGRVGKTNRLLNFVTVMAFVSVFGISGEFAGKGLGMLPGWTCYIGMSLMVLGLLIRQWAVAVLGKFFSGATGVLGDHRVVEAGPYRLVRHPSFSGVLLTQIGIGLSFQSWGAVLVIMPLFGLVYGYRLLQEEKELLSKLGPVYADYMKRTKRLIPYLI
jgi:protein-S-isoprenylcysteine O-methyltransferase Ste14